MANATNRAGALVLSPEEKLELERRMSDAERSDPDRLPAPVVDLFSWLRRRLASTETCVELAPEELAELDAAAAAAEDDLRSGRCITGEEMLAQLRALG